MLFALQQCNYLFCLPSESRALEKLLVAREQYSYIAMKGLTPSSRTIGAVRESEAICYCMLSNYTHDATQRRFGAGLPEVWKDTEAVCPHRKVAPL